MTSEEFLPAFTLGVEIICRLSTADSVAPAEYKIALSQTRITCGVDADQKNAGGICGVGFKNTATDEQQWTQFTQRRYLITGNDCPPNPC